MFGVPLPAASIRANLNILSPEENFTRFKKNLGKWYGGWTRWNPSTSEKLSTLPSLRDLSLTNDEGASIFHENTLWMPNGDVKKSNWLFDISGFKKDGLCHPGIEGTRGYHFKTGDTVFTHKNYGTLNVPHHVSELFINLDESTRCSVALIYDIHGEIKQIFLFRESTDIVWDEDYRNIKSLSNKPPFWSENDELKNFTSPNSWSIPVSGNREKLILQNDEMRIEEESTEWEGHFKEQSEVYNTLALPDNIFVNFPVQIKLGESFTLSTLWANSQNQEKRMIELEVGDDFLVKTAFSSKFG